MGWSIGYDETWKRDIGYGVPAWCDHPGCWAEIDRGLSYVCGGEPYGGDRGCGLYFCEQHLIFSARLPQLCARCKRNAPRPYPPVWDHPNWLRWKLRDASWYRWRQENPKALEEIRSQLRDYATRGLPQAAQLPREPLVSTDTVET